MTPGIAVVVATILAMATTIAFLFLGTLYAERYQRRLFNRAVLKMLNRRLDEDDREFRALMLETAQRIDGRRALPERGEGEPGAAPKKA